MLDLSPRPLRMLLIDVERLTKIYDEGGKVVTALVGVELSVHAGEFLAIMGPSGCGKSTLLHLLGGLDYPTSGRVQLDGQGLNELSGEQLAALRRRKIGLVFQAFNLIPVLTAAENVALPLLLDGVSPGQANARAAKWLARLGLGHRLKHRPNRLSGGERQRVAIARALVADPVLILADEPTGNLDSRAGEEIAGLLRQASDEWGQTVVMVTHDPQVAAYADRTLFLQDGAIVDQTIFAPQKRARPGPSPSPRRSAASLLFHLALALRYLSGRKLRTTLTTLAIMWAVMTVFFMQAIIPSMLKSYEANMMAVTEQVDVTITRTTGDAFSARLVEAVRAVDGVEAAGGFVRIPVSYPPDFLDADSTSPYPVSVKVIGLEPEAAQALYGYTVERGRWLQAGDLSAVVISKKLADARELSVGDDFPLVTPQGTVYLPIVGIRPAKSLPGPEEVMLPLAKAQRLYNLRQRINSLEAKLATHDSAKHAAIQAVIVGQLANAGDPDGRYYQINALPPDSPIVAKIRGGQALYSVFELMAMLMSGFIIFNSFRTVVAERRRDIGMLRAVGASRSTIAGTILAEGLLQAIVATLVGIALGYPITRVFMAAIPLMPGQSSRVEEIIITLPAVLITLGLGLGATLLAVLLPALSASRIFPLEALRPSTLSTSKQTSGLKNPATAAGALCLLASSIGLASGHMALTGLGALAFLGGLALVAPASIRPFVALFGRGPGRTGIARLARDNLARQPGRAAITASATMLSLAIIVAVAGMTDSLRAQMLGIIDKAMTMDYFFSQLSISYGADKSLVSQVYAVKGVHHVITTRAATATWDRKHIPLLGIDPQAIPILAGFAFLEGNETRAYAELARGRALIVNATFVAQFGVGPGDTLNLTTPSGVHPYRVVAVANDFLNGGTLAAYTSQADLAADFAATDDMMLEVYLAPGADRAAAEQQLRAIAEDYPQFQFGPPEEFFGTLRDLISTVLGAMYVILAALALPSVIGLINTLTIGVIERTHEIGLLRALGATQGQARWMILGEAVLLAGLGTAFGLLAGIYLGYAMMPVFALAGVPSAYAFPTKALAYTAVVGLLSGAVAAGLPARQAAGLEVAEALRYE